MSVAIHGNWTEAMAVLNLCKVYKIKMAKEDKEALVEHSVGR